MPTYTAPTTRTTGELISAAIFNTDLVENIKYFKDAPAFAGNVTVGGTLGVTGLITSTGGITGGASSHTTGAFSSTVTGGTYNGQTISSAANFTGSVNVTGALLTHKTSALVFEQESASVSKIRAYGADATTAGSLTISGLANDGSPSWDVLINASGNVTLPGVLTVSGAGTHNFTAASPNTLQVTNTGTGGGDYSILKALAGTGNVYLMAFSQGFTTSGPNVQSGGKINVDTAGGLSIVAEHASGAIRFYSGGTTERARFETTGRLTVGDNMAFLDGIINISGNLNTSNMMAIKASTNGTGGSYIVFENAAGGVAGYINQPTSTTVTYNTSSDMRIKRSHGRYTDVNALRQIVVHDAEFLENGSRFPMVFAQESYQWMPEVVTVGSADEDMSRIWGVDYGKFTPRLIVGWQQHDARLAVLEAKLLAAGV